jgi:hypothetical protein
MGIFEGYSFGEDSGSVAHLFLSNLRSQIVISSFHVACMQESITAKNRIAALFDPLHPRMGKHK